MANSLIIQKIHPYLKHNINRYENVYIVGDNIKKTKSKSSVTEIFNVSDDILTARLSILSKHQASLDGPKIFNLIVKNKYFSPFNKIGGKVYSESVFKKLICSEMETIYRSLFFADRIVKRYSIVGGVDLIPSTISYHVYKAMKKLNLVPEHIRVKSGVLLYMRLFELTRNLNYLIRFIVFPEKLLFQMRGKRNFSDKKKYIIGGHLYSGIGFKPKPLTFDFFIKNKDEWKNKIIYLIDEPSTSKYIDEVKESGYTIIDFNTDLIIDYNRILFAKTHYKKTIKLRFQFFTMALNCLFFSRTIYYAYRSELLWRIFNDNYEVNFFFHMMHPGDLASVAINQRYGAESVFFYCSTTHNRIDRKNNYNISEEVYYSNMIFDKIFSNKASNIWFKSNQNHVKEYVDVGSLMSDFVFHASLTRSHIIRKNLGLKKGRILLTFFDSVVGYRGTFTYSDQIIFLQSIYKILKRHNKITVVFKTKNKPRISLYPEQGKNATYIIEKLKNHKNFIYGNDKTFSSYDLMGVSDLVISAPGSSVLYESIIGGKKTISYDPSSRYKEDYILAEQFPNFCAHGFDELEKLIKYWLYDCDEKEFIKFQNKYIKRYFDDYCDGRAVNRLKANLNI